MRVLPSNVDTASEEFRANAAAMRTLERELETRRAHARDGGGEPARQRHRDQGKLPVRDRLTHLLDPGTPFLELSALAAHGMYDDAAPGAGLLTGIGRVADHEVMVVANDATV